MKNAVAEMQFPHFPTNDLPGGLLAETLLPENADTILTILTGPAGSGKTTLCMRLLALAAERSLQVGGVCSLPVMVAEKKTGIDLLTLPDRERRRLAVARKKPDARASPDTQALLKRWVIMEMSGFSTLSY